MKFLFTDLFLGMESLQGFLDVSSKLVVVFWGSVEDDYGVHVFRFGLWCNVEVPLVEDCSIKE